jgi:hypothetical protein
MVDRSMVFKRLSSSLVVLAVLGAAPAAIAQQPQLSEKAVKSYLDYAWTMLPTKFTRPDGIVVDIDKSTRDKVDIPVDMGREAVMAGRRSAYAQACGFPEEQVANYRSLMIREEDKKKWSNQQLVFINQVHLTTVMLLTGTIKLVETDDGGKEIKVEEENVSKLTLKKPPDDVCKQVLEQVKTYVEAGPPIPMGPTADSQAAGAAPKAAPSTTGTTAAPAAAKAPAQPKKP